MPLPDSSSGIRWSDYRNTTPTFKLTPVEKPDLSPFLIHMTGKNRLVKILKGETAPDGLQIPEKHGYLWAAIPSYDGQAALYYNSPVVCFTESPIFALDFFRYRSFRRWDSDQFYGIGFSKDYLVREKQVRPVLYLDSSTNGEILSLCNRAMNNEITFSENPQAQAAAIETFRKVKPLLFPLLENETYQGFMWEREWRCPNPEGLIFPYQSIRVICCPASEKDEILHVLGVESSSIEIVESWREYDEVTNYLKRRGKIYDMNALAQISQIKDLTVLQDLREKNEQTLHSLSAYYEVFKETVDGLESKSIRETINKLEQTSNELSKQIVEVKKAAAAKEKKA